MEYEEFKQAIEELEQAFQVSAENFYSSLFAITSTIGKDVTTEWLLGYAKSRKADYDRSKAIVKKNPKLRTINNGVATIHNLMDYRLCTFIAENLSEFVDAGKTEYPLLFAYDTRMDGPPEALPEEF